MEKVNYRKETCGGCVIDNFSPPKLSPTTKMLNAVLTFPEALKLQAALSEAIQRMNRLDQRKIVPTATVALHLNTSRISVHSFET